MALSPWPIALLFLCLGVSVLWESVPTMLEEYALLSHDVNRRQQFLERHGHLLADYPFLIAVVEESERIVSIGSILPAISTAWRTNSLITTVKAVGSWLGNNFLAQLLSPDTWQEKIFLLGVITIFLYIGAWVYMNNSRLKEYSRIYSALSKPTLSKVEDLMAE
jgi:hypothetical protein